MLGEGKGGQKQQWPDVKEAAVVLQWSRSFRGGGGALRWVPAGGGWQKLEPGLERLLLVEALERGHGPRRPEHNGAGVGHASVVAACL